MESTNDFDFSGSEEMVIRDDGKQSAGTRVRNGISPEVFAVVKATPTERELAKASSHAASGLSSLPQRHSGEEWDAADASTTPPLMSASSDSGENSSPETPSSPLMSSPAGSYLHLPPAMNEEAAAPRGTGLQEPKGHLPRPTSAPGLHTRVPIPHPASAPACTGGSHSLSARDRESPSPPLGPRQAPPSPGYGPASAGGSGSGAGRAGRESRIARALSSNRLVAGYGSGTAAGTLSEADPLPHSIRVLRAERVFSARVWEGRFISLWRKRVVVFSGGLVSVRLPQGHRPLFYLNAVTRVTPMCQGPTPFALSVTAVVAVRPDLELLKAAGNAPPTDSEGEGHSGDEGRGRGADPEPDSKLSPLATVMHNISQLARKVGGAAATTGCAALAAGQPKRRKASAAVATPRIEERQFMICMESENDFKAAIDLLDPDQGSDQAGGSTTSTHSLLW